MTPLVPYPVTDPAEIGPRLWAGMSGALAFDVGGYHGESVPFMRSRYGRVISFEPYPANYQACLAAGADVRLVAVSDHDGEVTLALHGGQLTSPDHELWEREDHGSAARFTVPCRTLDSVAADEGVPDLVQVDTEGHEVAVLEGAAGVLAAGRTSWLVEFHNEALHYACAALLEGAGLAVEVIRHPHYRPGSRLWYSHGYLKALPVRGRAAL